MKRVLIANRGEVALRIMRTARAMNIQTVAVYTESDQNALYVQQADFCYRFHSSDLKESYLSIDRMLDIAHKTGADAIHPGYGFLSECSDFARACEERNIIWIGPSASCMERIKTKEQAKRIAYEMGLSVIEGFCSAHNTEINELIHAAQTIGYPLMIKSVSCGGGKGMRCVHAAEEFISALHSAIQESELNSGSSCMILEPYLENARHIEVQYGRDSFGHSVVLSDRDCSVQRKHQKILEEAPAHQISDCSRNQLYDWTLRLIDHIDYKGIGTVEFLMDASEHIFFLEINPRLQVEHAVTECVTGQDLVEWQFKIANQEPITCQKMNPVGHAVEIRIYAEDTHNHFLPQSGCLKLLRFPDAKNLRIESGFQEGDLVSSQYDHLIAKLIVFSENRQSSFQQLKDIVEHTYIFGIKHNLNYLYHHILRILGAPDKPSVPREFFLMSGLAYTLRLMQKKTHQMTEWSGPSPWLLCDYWTLYDHTQQWRCWLDEWDGESHHIHPHTEQRVSFIGDAETERMRFNESNTRLIWHDDAQLTMIDEHFQSFKCAIYQEQHILYILHATQEKSIWLQAPFALPKTRDSSCDIQTEFNCLVVQIHVQVGQKVLAMQELVTVEAMKMYHSVQTPIVGYVQEILCQTGQQVARHTCLVRIAHHMD